MQNIPFQDAFQVLKDRDAHFEKITAEDLPKFNKAENAPSSSFRFPSFKDATDAYQREFILHKLAEFDGNVSRAAEAMGVDRSHLYRRMKNLGLNSEKGK